MKCPKCGYVSFNYLDKCKECGKDLVLFKKEKHIWGIKPGNLKLHSLPSEDSHLESMGLSTEEEMSSAIVTEAAYDPSPVLEELLQEEASQLETIELPQMEELEEPIELVDAAEEIREDAALLPGDQDEIVLEEEPAKLDFLFPAEEGEDKDLETIAIEVSAEPDEESAPLLLLDGEKQDIHLDLEGGEEDPPILQLEELDEALEELIILLEEEEKEQPEEGIFLGLEDSTDDLELSLDEDEEEETK